MVSTEPNICLFRDRRVEEPCFAIGPEKVREAVRVTVHRTFNVGLLVFAIPVEDVNRKADFLVKIITIRHEVPIEATVIVVEYDIGHRALNAKDGVYHGL